MNIDPYDFVHFTLYAMEKGIQGKTKLQKTVYFVGELSGCLGDLGYRAHYYGPYSEEVASAVGQLKALGFVDASNTTCGADPRGFERIRTDYRLNEDGKAVAEMKVRKYPDLWNKVSRAVTRFEEKGDRDYIRLSIAAKTHFMRGKKRGPATEQELCEFANKYGWKVTPHQVKEAAEYLESLRLVKVAKQ